MRSHKRARGVTLIELVMVVAILGIVASIAYPSYQERTRRANRTDAKAALLNLAAQQERFFLRNNRYATTLAELGIAANPALTENGFYKLTIDPDVSDASAFRLIAQPAADDRGQGLDTRCTEFSIDQLGRKSAEGSGDTPAQDCWR